MRNYPSDLTDRQWKVKKNMLPHTGRKRKQNIRTIWNGLMYLVKTGCQWRMLPKCFPGWQLLYYYNGRWRDLEIIEEAMLRLRELARSKRGKSPSPTAGNVDSQSFKGGLSAAMKGFECNKRVNGRKRHIVTDTNGWLLVDAAMEMLGYGLKIVMRNDSGQKVQSGPQTMCGRKVVCVDERAQEALQGL